MIENTPPSAAETCEGTGSGSREVDPDIAGDKMPDDYGTPAYESRWIRKKLKLPPDAKTMDVQGQMHVQEHRAHGYQAYIVAYKCDDKQGEIARQAVKIAELLALLQRAVDDQRLAETMQGLVDWYEEAKAALSKARGQTGVT